MPGVSCFPDLTALMGCNWPEQPHLGPSPTHTLLFSLGVLHSFSLDLCLSYVVSRFALIFHEFAWAFQTDCGLHLWLLDDCCTGPAQVLWGWACVSDSMVLESLFSLAFSMWSSLPFLIPENLMANRDPGRCLGLVLSQEPPQNAALCFSSSQVLLKALLEVVLVLLWLSLIQCKNVHVTKCGYKEMAV